MSLKKGKIDLWSRDVHYSLQMGKAQNLGNNIIFPSLN